MTETTWGAPIPVNGKRPEWLTQEDVRQMRLDCGYGERRPCSGADPLHEWNWQQIRYIRLPADHFAYRALNAGFEPWSGGGNPPVDWDGGQVLFRDGSLWMPDRQATPRWSATGQCGDIIGYHKRANAAPSPDPKLYQDLSTFLFKLVAWEGSFTLDADMAAAKALAKRLKPEDPDLLLARDVVSAIDRVRSDSDNVMGRCFDGGFYDDHKDVQAALAAIRKHRTLASQERQV